MSNTTPKMKTILAQRNRDGGPFYPHLFFVAHELADELATYKRALEDLVKLDEEVIEGKRTADYASAKRAEILGSLPTETHSAELAQLTLSYWVDHEEELPDVT